MKYKIKVVDVWLLCSIAFFGFICFMLFKRPDKTIKDKIENNIIMKSKTYVMWVCDTCEDGIMDTKRTKGWKNSQPCIFCKSGKMTKQNISFEIINGPKED